MAGQLAALIATKTEFLQGKVTERAVFINVGTIISKIDQTIFTGKRAQILIGIVICFEDDIIIVTFQIGTENTKSFK